MSWQMLDEPLRRPRLSWAVPEYLRDNSRYGPFRRLSVIAPLDPDALLQYVDNAISITENAQATRHLSLLFATSSYSSSPVSTSSEAPLPSSASSSASLLTFSSSSSSTEAVGQLCDGGPDMLPSVPSTRKLSRFKSVPLQQASYIHSSVKHNDYEEPTSVSEPNVRALSSIMNVQLQNEQRSTEVDKFPSKLPDRNNSQQFPEVEGVSKGDQMPDKGQVYDAQGADDAYRAACCALSVGDAELALSLSHVALAKCPPDKQNALGKVHRLIAATMQLMDKNSTVLRSLPVDKDA